MAALTHLEQLTAVKNETMRYINEHLPSVIERLRPLIGQKILLSDQETPSKRFTNKCPDPFKAKLKHYYVDTNSWFSFRPHSVWFHVKTCINGGSIESTPLESTPSNYFCEYYEEEIRLGTIHNQILVELRDMDMSGFKLEAVGTLEQDIKDFEAANKLARELFFKIPEHVRTAKRLRLG